MTRRLDQWLSTLGYASRREAVSWCRSGRVTRAGGGVIDRPDAKVAAGDVRVDGQPLDHPDGIFIVLHKPTGYVCSHDEGEGPTVYDLLPPRWRGRNPVPATIGRLDKDTSGVILVTDSGTWIHKLASPKHHVEKSYLATLDQPADAALADLFASGTLVLRGESTPCRPARLEPADGNKVRVSLTEGRYHQVRRMFAACGRQVVALHRESFGPYRADGLAPGEWSEAEPPVE
jgi:16S rRNA pseudouridine516 synthase